MKLKVNSNGDRIDKYISLNSDYSRSYIEKLISKGNILVNGKKVKASYIVSINDEIEICDIKENKEIKKIDMDIDVIYEDEYLMIINKQSGVVVHPGAGNHDNTLVNALVGKVKLSDLSLDRPGIVHRLDKDTSGVMVIAKDNKMHEALSKMFANHEIKRTYYALCKGVIPYNKGTIDVPIKKDDKHFDKMKPCEDGKKAITHFEVLKRYKNYTLLRLNLETGRTHQIRVHLSYMGYPVYNDPVYGKGNTSFGQFLHSKEIDFIEPFTGKHLHFETDLPKEFNDFLNEIKEQ